MWVMDDSRRSWSKWLTIKDVPSIELPLAFWKRDELIMAAANRRIVSYILVTRKLNNLLIHHNEHRAYNQAIVYAVSIVSVKRDNKKLKGIELNRLVLSEMLEKHSQKRRKLYMNQN
ncbi:F-box/kelch-repeat protein [Pyrus ussuriensis x Pyrus communis]|uniref:F-box/kelch-repeat protein n=1 Tax=Pyrus ussuriensis x Pyrus communis TaxID=2448454 RepID=A0A5N5G289_9ROSA|nr:F-box/kelch-repeat protein [Pyrus ussuriensis x Pyrus communis]